MEERENIEQGVKDVLKRSYRMMSRKNSFSKQFSHEELQRIQQLKDKHAHDPSCVECEIIFHHLTISKTKEVGLYWKALKTDL